jgi:hypothetical protein
MSIRRDKGRLPPFVPLLVTTLDSPAWRATSHGARSLYVALKRRVPKGRNTAHLAHREAVKDIGSKNRIGEWFSELEHYGFTVKVRHGSLGSDGNGKATVWRLTELGQTSKASAGGLFEPPTCDFLKWKGVRFKPRRCARTPGSYGCKKQKPVHDGGDGVSMTGGTVLSMTGGGTGKKTSSHLGKARHPSHRFLDDPRREIKQRADLHTPVGVACRSRDEVDGIPERSCLAQGPRRQRARWTHRREHQQPDPHTNVLLGAEINQRLTSED